MLKQFLNKLYSYIEFSTFERRGVFSLLFILLLVSGYYSYKNSAKHPSIKTDEAKLEKLRNNIKKSLGENSADLDNRKANKPSYEKQKGARNLTVFDPNHDSLKALVDKGVPYNVAKNIISYREKVGFFQDKEDLKNLYTVDADLFFKLRDFIKMEEVADSASSESEVKKETPNILKIEVEVNTATADELMTIPGIGPAYAKWIIEYRDKLGGFIGIDQLLEVYRMDENKLRELSGFIRVDQIQIKTLSLNRASVEDLAKHPYLSYKQAKSIVSYREEHGKYTSVENLGKLFLFTDSDVNRLLPYLDTN